METNGDSGRQPPGGPHIHLVLEIPPKYSVSAAVGFLKDKSAIEIFDFHL
jgi:REP element-mobilizing transposase RayT